MRRFAASPTTSFPTLRSSFLLLALLAMPAPARSAEDSPAVAALRQRADSGDAEAMVALGDAFASGEGVSQDLFAAWRSFNQAASRGYAPAFFRLGELSETGRGTRLDLEAAFRAYAKSAELGWVPAQLKLGDLFASGTGTQRDDATAAEWYRRAALAGLSDAQFNLAQAYEQGRGVAKDRAQAQKWYRDAANQGNARARFNLALMLEGGLGSGADASAAAALYRAAAEQGFAPAQNNYGLLLAEGRGSIPANLIEACAWLTVAVENGANPAGLNLVTRKLNASQLAAADQRAAELRTQLAGGVVSAAPAVPVEKPVLEKVDLAPPVPPAIRSSSVVAAAPENAVAVPSVSPSSNDTNNSADLQHQLVAAKEEIAALKAEQERLRASSTQMLADLSDLMADAAEAVKTRVQLVKAERSLRTAERAPATGATANHGGASAPPDAKKDVERLRTQAAVALAKWNERLARLNTAEELAHTVASASAPGVQSAVAVSTADAALQAENARLSARVAELVASEEKWRTDSTRLTEENSKLMGNLRAVATKADAPKPDPAAVAEWASEREILQTKVREATAKLAEAERRLAQKQSPPELTPQQASRLAAAESENADLSARLKTLGSANDQLQAETARLKSENQTFSAGRQAADEAIEAVKHHAEQASAWAAEREKLQREMREAGAKLAAAEHSVEDLRTSQRTAGENSEQIAQAKNENAELSAKLRTLSETNERLQQQVTQLESDNRSLKSSQQTAAEATRAAQQAGVAADEVAKERDALRQQVASLNEKLADAERRAGEAKRAGDAASQQIESLQRESAKIQAELAAATKGSDRVTELEVTVQKLSAEKAELQQAVAGVEALRSENNRLAAVEKNLLSAQKRVAELESTAAQLNATQRDVGNLTAENARLNAALRAGETDRQNQTAQLTQQNAQLAARLRQAQAALDQIAAAARIVNGGSASAPVAISNGVAPAAAPTSEALVAPPSGRLYTVIDGDSLTKISIRYYGTGNRWQEIYLANRDVLRGQNTLRVGQLIRVP